MVKSISIIFNTGWLSRVSVVEIGCQFVVVGDVLLSFVVGEWAVFQHSGHCGGFPPTCVRRHSSAGRHSNMLLVVCKSCGRQARNKGYRWIMTSVKYC